MTQSVQNFDNRNNRYAVPANTAPVNRAMPAQVRIPEYYVQDDKHGFKEAIEESPMYTPVKTFFGPLIDHPVASILTWFGCGFLLDKYTSACGGEYNKSLLNKVVKFGDNIENSKFVQSKPVQKVLGFFKSNAKKGGKLANKNSVIKAIRETPTMPEWEMVKSEMIPQRQRVVHDFNNIVNELKLSGDGFAPLRKLAVDNAEKEALKNAFGVAKISEIPEEVASSYIQLKRLGKSEEFINQALLVDGGVPITKQEILKAMGNKTTDWIKAVREDTIGEKIAEVQEATKKLGGKVKIGMGNYKPFGINLGPLTIPIKRTLSCDNIYNRLRSLDPQNGATATGRFMSRFMQMVHRGLTFGGGKIGVLLFIAPAFVETAINVYKAEPNQKVGTGISNLTNHISWVFTFPFALQIMHHICGAQYAGMKKEDVQALRKLQTDFNKRNEKSVKDGGFANRGEYEKERERVNKEMKKLREVTVNGKKQKWYTRGIRKLAGILTPDLGKLDAYNTHNAITTKFSQLRNLPRNLVGVPLRLILFGVLTMGVLDAIINKTIKFCFGDSYDSMKEEEIKDAKKEQKKFLKEDLNDRLYETQKKKLAAMAMRKKNQAQAAQQQSPNPQGQGLAHRGAGFNSNAIPQVEPQSADHYSYIPSQENLIKQPVRKGSADNYSYIPSQDPAVKLDKNGNVNSSTIRTYVPSQAAANINKSWDNSILESALARADRAETRAYKILSGDFEGI